MVRTALRQLIDTSIWLQSLFVRPAPSAPAAKKRILIIRKDGLGDCVLFYATLRAYREYYRDAEIHLVLPLLCKSLDPVFGAYVDHIIWFDHGKFGSSYAYRRNFMLNLKRTGYSEALYPVYTREPIGDTMIAMTQAKRRVGFATNPTMHYVPRRQVYTEIVEVPETMEHELDRNRLFAERVTGAEVTATFPTITPNMLPPVSERTQPYAVIFPGSGQTYKIWPPERFAAIGDMLASRGYSLVICGGKGDKDLVQKVIAASATPALWTNLCGQTDVATLTAIISRAALYFGSDTGALHLAVAVGTPTVAIIGSGSIRRFFPYGDPAKNRAVYDPTYPDQNGDWGDPVPLPASGIHPSITNVTVEMAERELVAVLQ